MLTCSEPERAYNSARILLASKGDSDFDENSHSLCQAWLCIFRSIFHWLSAVYNVRLCLTQRLAEILAKTHIHEFLRVLQSNFAADAVHKHLLLRLHV